MLSWHECVCVCLCLCMFVCVCTSVCLWSCACILVTLVNVWLGVCTSEVTHLVYTAHQCHIGTYVMVYMHTRGPSFKACFMCLAVMPKPGPSHLSTDRLRNTVSMTCPLSLSLSLPLFLPLVLQNSPPLFCFFPSHTLGFTSELYNLVPWQQTSPFFYAV